MKIKNIEYENFRNFKDHGMIKCSTDGKVTIIYGKNGDGKTTLHVTDCMTMLCESGSKDHILFCFPDSVTVQNSCFNVIHMPVPPLPVLLTE